MKPVRMENGQGLVEYALLIVFVAIVVILILGIFGTTVGQVFSNTISML
ncbi:MAG: pilus assembly protein [Anaerolineae bacterium]|nr:MAG: pilus assembly protein [Anaerolineae bacterium]